MNPLNGIIVRPVTLPAAIASRTARFVSVEPLDNGGVRETIVHVEADGCVATEVTVRSRKGKLREHGVGFDYTAPLARARRDATATAITDIECVLFSLDDDVETLEAVAELSEGEDILSDFGRGLLEGKRQASAKVAELLSELRSR
jgi:hypothetical protein